jgi:hypothetical protein
VLDMILYGHRAHVKLEQRRKIEPWLANDGLRGMLKTRSAEILEAIIKHLISLRAFNEETLTELERGTQQAGLVEGPGAQRGHNRR